MGLPYLSPLTNPALTRLKLQRELGHIPLRREKDH